MDFSRVLVTDALAWEIFGAAAREKLLFVRRRDALQPLTRPGAARQQALSLLVLFDHLVIHEWDEGTFRLPDLEKEGIVEIIPAYQIPDDVPALRTDWRKRVGGSPFSKSQLKSLWLIQQFRPLVINRILKTQKDGFPKALAKAFGGSRRNYLDLFFDFVLAVSQGDMEGLFGENGLRTRVQKDTFLYIVEEVLALFDFPEEDGILNPWQATFVLALLTAHQIAIIQALSTKLRLGVATDYYGDKFRSEPALQGKALDAVAAANQFLILRAAFADEGIPMPKIEGIDHALALRRNPHLKAVREQLKIFHHGLTAGDRGAVLEARREIQAARRKLERRAQLEKGLRWLTHLCVPIGIAEMLIGSALIGFSLSVIGSAGTATSQRVETENEWVLFGT